MACSSTGANTKVAFQAEDNYGEVPTTIDMKELPVASVSMSTSKDEIVDARLDGSRNIKDVTFGNSQVAGEVSGDFSAIDYDDYISSFMFNDWAGNNVDIGNALKSFTMEEQQLDILKYRKFTGMVANTMSVEAPIDGNATISFSLVGRYEGYDFTDDDINSATVATDADTSLDSSVTPAVFNTPFRHVNGTVSNDAGTMVGVVQGITLEGDNGIDPQFVWGKSFVDCQVAKKVNITGSITIYYVDESEVQKWLQGTSLNLNFGLTDGTNTYTFQLGKIYYTGADMGVGDDGVRTISMPFRAVDSGTTSLQITKS